jgi:hypothetical protein
MESEGMYSRGDFRVIQAVEKDLDCELKIKNFNKKLV